MEGHMKSLWWFWLSVVAVNMIVALPAQAPKPSFDVASIKKWVAGPPSAGVGFRQADGAFDRSRTSVASLIEFAFDVPAFQVLGGPDWVRRDNFEVHARGDKAASLADMRLMVQSLLRDRFSLRSRIERREMPSYALSLARPDGRLGSGLRPASDPSCKTQVKPPTAPDGAVGNSGCGSIERLATLTSTLLAAPVIDRTGLSGAYEWSYYFSREGLVIARSVEPGIQPPPADPATPPLTTAFREQLGLRLEAGRAPVQVLVIDSVQPPSQN
jgi:uncharacterized protein (TIGR03435 family)